ncbi:MAG TPA: lysophospholipid acyltransferase family protein [Burkholderiaceae bacterium]
MTLPCTARALVKVARLLAHIVAGLITIHWRFPRLGPSEREAEVQRWARGMLARLGIALVVEGSPAPAGPLLLVANHISWLDILVVHAARYCRFVSKADVQRWPLIGTLATAAGTLYIARESPRDAVRMVHHMAESLRAGDVVAVFPEGTTSDGLALLPFHANLLQAAISAEAPVQPIALQFTDSASGATSLAPCYIGDDTLVASIWRTLCADPITAVVRFGPPQQALGRDRRRWATDLREDITRMRPGH